MKKIKCRLNIPPVEKLQDLHPKSAARYINDTLFASNIGSVLISFNFNKDKINWSFNLICLIAFFIFFRVKAFLDDNYQIILNENLNEKNDVGNLERFNFVISIICWFSFSLGGFFIFGNSIITVMILFSFLFVFLLFMLILKIANFKTNGFHNWFIIANFIYLIIFIFLSNSFCENQLTNFNIVKKLNDVHIFQILLLLLLVIDYYKSKSLLKIFT